MNKNKQKKSNNKNSNMLRLVKQVVNKQVQKNIETKFVDTSIDGTTGIIYGTALIQRITTIAQGTADINRVGDRVLLNGLSLKFNCVAGDTVNRVRVSVIRWQEDDGSVLPTNSSVYQGITSSIQAFFNYDGLKGGRFKVLYDKIVDVETQNGDTQLFYHKTFNLKKAQIGFTGSVSGRGHLYVIVNSDSAGIPHPTFDGLARVTYKDA